jgi:hypothetical protein
VEREEEQNENNEKKGGSAKKVRRGKKVQASLHFRLSRSSTII